MQEYPHLWKWETQSKIKHGVSIIAGKLNLDRLGHLRDQLIGDFIIIMK